MGSSEEDREAPKVTRACLSEKPDIPCEQCQRGVILDERSIGPQGLTCPECRTLVDPRNGSWVPRNPTATWGKGYWICHAMVPWINFDELLDRQRVYDIARFKNEVLGLPTALGDHVVTRSEMEACCGDRRMAQGPGDVPPVGRGMLIAGVDWGGGGVSGVSRTVLVIGFIRSDNCFEIVRMDKFAASEEPETTSTPPA